MTRKKARQKAKPTFVTSGGVAKFVTMWQHIRKFR